MVRFVGLGNGASTRLFFGLRCVVIGIGAWGLGCYTTQTETQKENAESAPRNITLATQDTKGKREAANEVVDGVPAAGEGGGGGGGGGGRSASTTTLTPPPLPQKIGKRVVLRCGPRALSGVVLGIVSYHLFHLFRSLTCSPDSLSSSSSPHPLSLFCPALSFRLPPHHQHRHLICFSTSFLFKYLFIIFFHFSSFPPLSFSSFVISPHPFSRTCPPLMLSQRFIIIF